MVQQQSRLTKMVPTSSDISKIIDALEFKHEYHDIHAKVLAVNGRVATLELPEYALDIDDRYIRYYGSPEYKIWAVDIKIDPVFGAVEPGDTVELALDSIPDENDLSYVSCHLAHKGEVC